MEVINVFSFYVTSQEILLPLLLFFHQNFIFALFLYVYEVLPEIIDMSRREPAINAAPVSMGEN